jgi:hypothetical protein
MITFTWIIGVISITVLVVGIIATIVVRIDNIPKWKTVSKILIWVIGLIIFRIIFWWLVKYHEEYKSAPPQITKSSAVITKSPEYEWSWELPRGQQVRGFNKSVPMVAEIIPRTDGALWIDTHHVEYGSPEVARIRLAKVGEKSWEGTWEQDNPQDSGRCSLHEVSTGTWAGQMIGKAQIPAFCTLKRK